MIVWTGSGATVHLLAAAPFLAGLESRRLTAEKPAQCPWVRGVTQGLRREGEGVAPAAGVLAVCLWDGV